MDTAARIKVLRERDGLSQAGLSKKLCLSRSAISMYESGERIPSTPVLNDLADIFNVDTDYLIGRTDKITVLPERLAYENKQRSQQIDKTINIMQQLTIDGQTRVADYADDLYRSGRYTRANDDGLPIADQRAVYATGSLSAGNGYYNDDTQQAERLVMAAEVPPYDLVADVRGNSMEPTIKDGDVAFVVSDYDQVNGQIYAVEIDGEAVVKRCYFEHDRLRLVSDNRNYPDRIIKEPDTPRIIGRVVGWATPVK